MEQELIPVRLYCNKCGNMFCQIHPIGKWFNVDAELLGCTRRVDENLAAQYDHIKDEVLPFLHMNKNIEHNDEIYNELESIENKIYAAPLGVVLDEKGKVKK